MPTEISPQMYKGGEYRPNSRNPLPGFYRGRVEYNRDPLKLGRVKVRVPQLHGFPDDEGAIPTSALPWASPGIFIGAGYDMGQFIVPHVGTFVWVSWEEGDPDKPIYFGGIPSTGGQPKVMNHIGDIPKDNHPDYMSGPWYAGTDGDAPKDVYLGRSATQDVTRGVIFKSPKGHTILYDDTDGAEAFAIIDRVGQIIKFICPVSVNDNKANASRRGVASATNENQLAKSPGAKIVIKSGNLSQLNGSSVIEISPGKILLQSKDSDGNVSTIEITPKRILIDSPLVDINPNR